MRKGAARLDGSIAPITSVAQLSLMLALIRWECQDAVRFINEPLGRVVHAVRHMMRPLRTRLEN